MVPDRDLSKADRVVPAKLLQLRANLDRLERQLSDGRPFLLGDRPSLADLSAYHAHRFLEAHPTTRALLRGLRHLPAWMQRVAKIGHGKRTELDAKDAIAMARSAAPAPIEGETVPMPEGLAPGDAVVVVPEEPGSGTVAGELVATGVHEIAVRRRSERAGELIVHFPREDYLVVRAR